MTTWALNESLNLAAQWETDANGQRHLTLWSPCRIPGVWMPVEFLVGKYACLVGKTT